MPIMKYIGISVSSQKTKKRKRSSETKTPIMAGLDHEQRDEEALHVFVDRFPGAEDGDRREERGQQNEEQADAVDAEVVVNGLADPFVHFRELITRRCRSRSREAEAAK